MTHYIKVESMHKTEPGVSILSMMDFAAPKSFGPLSVQSIVQAAEVDCSTRRIRTKLDVIFPDTMGKDRLLHINKTPSDWTIIPKNARESAANSLVEWICDSKR